MCHRGIIKGFDYAGQNDWFIIGEQNNLSDLIFLLID